MAVLQTMPQLGEVFRLQSSTTGDTDPVFGIYTPDGIQELNFKQQLLDYQKQWEGLVQDIGGQVGKTNQAMVDAFEDGSSITVGGKTYTLSSERKDGNLYRYLTSPDGEKTLLGTGGFSSGTAMIGKIAQKTMDLPEGVKVGYNIHADSPENKAAMEKSFLGETDTSGLNTYLRGLVKDYITETPLSAEEFQANLQGATQTDQGLINQTIAPAGTPQPTSATPWEEENEANYQKWLAEKAGQEEQIGPSGDPANVQDMIAATGGVTGVAAADAPGVQDLMGVKDGQIEQPLTAQPTVQVTGSPEAMALVDKLLKANGTANPQSFDWWNTSPVKGEAWELLQQTLASPEAMAQYVKDSGLTNLQNYDWWSTSPFKQDAWKLIDSSATQAQQFQLGADPTTGEVPIGEPGQPVYNTPDGQPSGDLSGTGMPDTAQVDANDPLQNAYSIIDASEWLTADQKALYKDVVKGWEPGTELNMENIMTQFKKIQSETIDPYYQNLTNQAMADITSARDFQITQREMQMEQERTQAGQAIRQTKEGLEKAGMTFTGQAIEDLGKESAFAQTGEMAVKGLKQQPVEGGYFYEGTVNQANRLMSSSSQARYLKQMQELQRQAEQTLGSGQATTLNIPGGAVVGGVEGSLAEQKKQQEASTLSSLYQQEQQNLAAKTPIAPF
jgi:hypothetical protein